MRVMYVEGAGCRSSGVGMSPGTWCRKLLREAIRATHVSRSHSLVLSGVALGGGVYHVGLAVADAALGAVRGVRLGVVPSRWGFWNFFEFFGMSFELVLAGKS